MKKLLMFATILSASAMADSVKLKIDGMVCSFCVQGIEKKLSAEKGIHNVKVDLDSGLVVFDDHGSNADDTIKKIIVDAGYTVKSLERKK